MASVRALDNTPEGCRNTQADPVAKSKGAAQWAHRKKGKVPCPSGGKTPQDPNYYMEIIIKVVVSRSEYHSPPENRSVGSDAHRCMRLRPENYVATGKVHRLVLVA